MIMKKISTLLTVFFILTGILHVNAQTVLLTEDFENGFPANWTQSSLATDSGFIYGDNLTLSSGYLTIPAHTNFVATNDDVCNCDKSADYLILPPQDFTGHTTIELVAEVYFEGNEYPAGFIETASVEVSTNSGATWTVAHDIIGYGTQTYWSSLVVDLSAYANMQNVWVAFRYNDATAWSYGIAVDDVAVNSSIVSVNELNDYVNNLNVFPSPATDNIQISFGLPSATELEINILDITGRTVKNEKKGFVNQGSYNYILNINDLEAGLYTVMLITESGNSIRQLIVN